MKLSLTDVTLLAVTSVEIEKTHHALLYSSQYIDFGAVKLLSPISPKLTNPRITYVPTPQFNYISYSRFIFESLHSYVSTKHCLIIQADGFVLNPDRWLPEFMDYDYIGAPWPEFINLDSGNHQLHLNRNRVGNGGFSLRSKRLLEITSRINFNELTFPILSEDLVICHYLYDQLCSAGLRFAPMNVAARFSVEHPYAKGTMQRRSTFGFHGSHWLDELAERLPAQLRERNAQSLNDSSGSPGHEPSSSELNSGLRVINILVTLQKDGKPIDAEEYAQLKQLTLALLNNKNSDKICLMIGSEYHCTEEILGILTQLMLDLLAADQVPYSQDPPNLIPAPTSQSDLDQLRPYLACELPLAMINCDAIQNITVPAQQLEH